MYAPAERSAQAAFFTSAVAMLQQRPGLPVWGGDFNFVEQPSLDRRTSRRSDAAELKVAAAWQQQLSSHSLHLVDTFRHSHPRRTTFSHFSPVGAARLDRIYAATALQRYVAEASVGGTPDCSVSDHRAVTLALLPTPAAGSCRALARRVRLHFTADPALRQAFRNAVAQAASTAPATPAAFLTWWPWFKRRLRAAAEHCNHRLRAARQQGSAAAGAALSQLYEQYEGGDDAGLGPLLQHRQRTAEAVKAELVAASMAERRQWLHAGERPSPTFTAKLRAPTSRGVAGLRAPDGTLHTAAPAVARLFVQQTARVSTEPSTDPAAQQEVLAAIAAGPQLSAQQAQQLGSTSIDAAEVRRALRRSKPGTAPGLDGIPVQLYRKFADVLAPLLARLFTSMGTTGSAPRGFNRGVISFLYKKGDPCLASNYRPITLLNTDYRLLSKVLAHRLGRCLHSLVSPEQAAFLRGRSIGENAHLLQLLPHLLARHGRWALVAFCDFRKAYDTVHRGFLLAVLRQLGLGDGFVSWALLRLLQARGVGIQAAGLNLAALQFAEDCKALLEGGTPQQTADRVQSFQAAMATFAAASGQHLAPEKTHLLPIGSQPPAPLPPAIHGLQVVPTPEALGLQFHAGTHPATADWQPRLQRVEAAHEKLASLGLSAFGRGFGSAAYGVSQLLYCFRSGTTLLTALAEQRRQQERLQPYAAAFGAALGNLRSTLKRLWRLPWENCRKEPFWRLIYDAFPTAARMHLPDPCICGGAPADRQHHFWDCPVARGDAPHWRGQGRKALLTGASRGIGAAVACALAKEGASLTLIAHPHHEQDLKQTADKAKSCGAKECSTQCVDFADPQAVQKLADQCAGQGIDVLINNAGILGSKVAEETGPLKGNPDDWDRVMKVNALAPMRLIRALAPKMCDNGEGWIINISDVEAVHEGPHHAAYAASKHALRGFGLSAYEALRKHNVKVVDLAPGNVAKTGMAEKSDMHAGQGAILPEDVAEAVLFCFRLSKNAVPEEIVLKALKPGTAQA
ncbi:reverse transcriptase [Micractinium conductrix]|uniref:Reverse transcriptase n=1 Tax=Micractinium conductrix TaxID=554055 RepID=A0A2P6VQW8_9CHLO|nr:reverse transcriptase [Micractinium conductrix]|eukprot:PSC76482.1 reverse transcriptase [Micractinium conductrix]